MPDMTKSQSGTAVDTAVDAVAPPTEVDSAPAAGPAPQGKPRSLWGDAWFELRHRPLFWVSAVLLVLLLSIAVFPGLFSGADPKDGDLTNHFLTKPELTHFFQADWFGYDGQGRSIYARVIYGTRASIMVGVGVTVVVTIFGGLLGMLAGYFGGWIDSIVSRIVDIFLRSALPARLDGRAERVHRAQGVRGDRGAGLPGLDHHRPGDAQLGDHGQAGGLRHRGARPRRGHQPDPVPGHPAERAWLHGSLHVPCALGRTRRNRIRWVPAPSARAAVT